MTEDLPPVSSLRTNLSAGNGNRDAATAGTPRPLARSRRRGMVVGGVLLVVACGVLAAFVVGGAAHRMPVVVLARDVPVGQRLMPGDLRTAMVGTDAAVRTVPGDRLHQMTGLVAATDLRQGTLLAPSEVTTALTPAAGQMLVTVSFKPGALPGGLRPGDQVVLVPTLGAAGQDGGASSVGPLTQQMPAVVDAVGAADADGAVAVDFLVSANVGPAIVQQASLGRIGLGVTARRGGG